MTLAEMKNEAVRLSSEAASLQHEADTQNRSLSAEEQAAIDNNLSRFETLTTDIERRERIENAAAKLTNVRPRKVGAEVLESVKFNPTNALDQFVKNVAFNPEILRNSAATTYAGEGTAADGGYLAPTEYSKIVQQLLAAPESIVGMCDSVPVTSNSIVLPVDESPAWASTGIAPSSISEGAAYTATKPEFKALTITLAKYGILVPASEELLADGVGVGQYIANKSAEKLLWKTNQLAWTAFLASAAKITVAKTSGAAAASYADITNILSLFAKVPSQLRASSVFFANPLYETNLMQLVIPNTTVPAYLPPNGLSAAPFGTLFGRPIIFSELCSAVGTAGDIAFVAPRAFYAVTKGGATSSVNPYLYWDADQVAFKTSIRMAVASKFQAAITRPDNTTVGNVAVLATRA